MLFDEGDDKMVKTEAFPTIRMKIDRLLKITNEYQFNDLVKAVYCINLCINNRSVLESCLALNACLIEYEEKGSKRIGTYDEFKGFFGKIYDVMKPGIADDYTVEDFGEVQLRYNDKFYRVIIGTGHNNVYACLNFLPTLARNISREEELCLALEYVSGTIDYFIEENKNDGVVEKRFVLPTEILFYKVQKFFKEEVKKYDILELDSLMMSEGTTIEKSHFVCREDNIYPLYNVSLLIDLYDIWENKIDFKEQISVANEGIIDRIYSLFEMDRSRSCSIFAPAMIFPEQKYDSSQRTYTFIAKASRGVVVALNADEIFAQYIEKLKQNNREYLETVLDTVTDFMIHSDNYDEISITDLEKTGITSGDIRKTVNSGILLSKKLVFHEGTIARNEKEVVYFVFDEMRDYCLARQILLNNISAYNVDGESVIEKLKQLKATGASCTEGVIHYCYVFFKTDELVSKLGQTEKMCNSILDLYRIPEGGERKSYWSMRYREELQNLGLRIILTSGLELTDFEITYIQDCLRKDPYEDGGMFFDTMLDGTLYGGIYNLDIYLGILFGLKNKDAILNTFHTISARNNMDDRFIPEDFIKYYNELSDSERKLQIQKIAELFLLCFKLHDKDKQEELEDFFYNLPTHDKVQNDMILEMRIACGLEVKDYE